jgi:hypothetical protein
MSAFGGKADMRPSSSRKKTSRSEYCEAAGAGATNRVGPATPPRDSAGMATAKPLIFLIAVSVMAWAAGMAIHGF